jgi:hypothetical protein
MKSITRTAFQLLLSAILVHLLAFGSAAKQNGGGGEGIGSADHALITAQARDGEGQSKSGEQAREREEALERMDKARHRDETAKEETPPKGLEKQREKKSEQERKEIDKGSEQGQKMREEHSRKWWKFWE